MKESELPVVALVGEPNAGKSTLFNKITGKRLAVTSKVAGTTRDRQYAQTSWNGKDFVLLDTAGMLVKNSNELELNVQKQIDFALEEADVLVVVVDGKSESVSFPKTVLSKLRKTKKPVLLAINKTDSARQIENNIARFARLGIKESFAVSAVTGSQIGDLLDIIVEKLSDTPIGTVENNEHLIHVGIVGKPNVGKSSLFNTISGQDRVVVSEVPGTTRSSIDSKVKFGSEEYVFIDTAGLKKKQKQQIEPDIFSGFQTFKSIRRSDVVLLVVSAFDPITLQDQRLASEILKMEKGLILVANKTDLYQGSLDALQAYLSEHFRQLKTSPVFFVSAKTGEGVAEMLKVIKPIAEMRKKEVAQEDLDKVLKFILKKNPPRKMLEQKNPKVYSLTQTDSNPPTFELYVNHPAAISKEFRNALKKAIIHSLDFWGAPIVLKLKGKDKK